MPASDYEYEVSRAIRNSANPADNVVERCAGGGLRNANETDPHRIPIIREWEYAASRIIAFSTVDSCLGALQIADGDRLRGAHFSMYASGAQFDVVQFNAMMASAGFQLNLPILYFGGGVDDWRQGLGVNGYMGVGPFAHPVFDENQRAWIFEVKNGVFTYHSWRI
ncbi:MULTISPECIES: hypothetical protein [unclassified Xanthomonas]|uniref:hypothetical protein n=1 Tax=unclassified Xanthomonas TaxID=2643310 RepID=UPI0028831913|nr:MULTISPECIES: hypothetical protein [unclassified Xanthomonas]